MFDNLRLNVTSHKAVLDDDLGSMCTLSVELEKRVNDSKVAQGFLEAHLMPAYVTTGLVLLVLVIIVVATIKVLKECCC
jgi:hypothetical protein